jgi:dihydrofolate synthase/folylpolyglutamate synthase
LSDKSLSDWLQWLETLSPREIVLGLERVQAVLGRLQLSRPGLVVQIAGTNGKGSCAAILEAILQAAGESTGCYTSPHLCHYNERIRVAQTPCNDEEIIESFARIEAVRGDLPLTYFEFGTLAALHRFDVRGVSAAILEVGMGGRLDAVNAVEADGGIITNVALDHCAWLGTDVETIAVEKAGIMRAGKPLIFGSADVPASLLSCAEQTDADLRLAGRDFDFSGGGHGKWNFQGRRTELQGLRTPSSGGAIQLQNAAAVLALLEAIGRTDCLETEIVNSAIAGLRLPGRLQLVNANRDWVLDVAHNAAAAQVLAASLEEIRGARRITAIVSVLGDKDIAEFVAHLCPLVDRWIAVGVDASRSRSAHEIAQVVANSCNKACLVGGPLAEAMRRAEETTDADDLILLTGSFYVVGPALDELYSRRTGE